jgi:ABC-type transport system involved in multi-copper enzyme maturation permease subunit
MLIRNNPVLHRELMINLRTDRSFLMLLLFQLVLAGVIYFAWPTETRLDLSEKSQANRELVDFFFLGQFVIASLLAPSFAAGSICGEKERLTYEMLLASPLSTVAVTWGKWMASVTHLLLMMVASLPIVMLCLPLGGVSPLEVMGGYFGMTVCLLVFSMISLTCSSVFSRTSSALVTSYILILPLLLIAGSFWFGFRNFATFRLQFILAIVPTLAIPFCVALFHLVADRMLYPPDIGSEGKDVVDQDLEKQEVVGLYIDRNAWPDRWFAPAKRTTLMEDHLNPVYDKEMRSEILSQGTLMMRVLIQVGFVLSVLLLPTLYFATQYAFVFPCYIVVFNILLGPVFSAGAITSERERQTLDLLLTTTLSPWTIVLGKMMASFRVSTVLTLLMAWPLVLGIGLNFGQYAAILPSIIGYFVLILLTCVSTTIIGTFCSSLCRKSSHAMAMTYSLILLLYFAPPAMEFFFAFFLPDSTTPMLVEFASLLSPFSAAARLPAIDNFANAVVIPGRTTVLSDEQWWSYHLHFLGYVLVTTVGLGLLMGILIARFNRRWLVSFGDE